MNPSIPPLPAPPLHAETAKLSLDDRIRAAEGRLVEREQRLRRSFDRLTQGVRRATQPRRGLLPVLGATVAAVLWWVWRARRRNETRSAAPARTVHVASPGDMGDAGGLAVPWVHLIALAWPLLPAGWRARVSPALAGTLVGLVLPVVEGLLRGRAVPPLATMPRVDLSRYAGGWHVLARLPAPRRGNEVACTAHYERRAEGGLRVDLRCVAADGSLPAQQGVARVVAGSGGARLQLSWWPEGLRWLSMSWSEHWILHVDDSYSEALVGSPRRDFLWLLAREADPGPKRLQRLVLMAQERGYAVERLHFGT